MLDVRRMRVLREVGERGSMAAAAETLHITASAVSQHVAALEREAGVALVERGPRGVRLTAAGSILARETSVIIARLDAVHEEILALGGLRAGVLRLGAFATAAATLMAPAIGAFARRHPDLDTSFVEGDPDETMPSLRRGELDLVLTYDYDLIGAEVDDAVCCVELLEDPFRVVVPAGHPAVGEDGVALADLRDEDWIAEARPDCRPFLPRACASAGFEPRVWSLSSDYRVSMALVAERGAVALIPSLALHDPPPGVVVLTLRDRPLVRRIHAAHRVSGERVPAVAAMLAQLTVVAAALGGRSAGDEASLSAA